MTAKRALIVDDSKSARAFLSRVLEKYEIGVETAESAEQAIEHLATHRPDVIFMDHLMPGMDGFQAVQLIKNNPRTATIPIMMYTSQEGELYLGQARALGAVGVLPKQIRPADVTKVLYQLKLVPDRRTGEQTSFRPLGAEAADSGDFAAGDAQATAGGATADAAATDSFPAPLPGSAAPGRPAAAPELRELVESALHGQIVELRQFVTMSLDNHAARTASDVRTLLQDLPRATPPAPQSQPNPLAWVLACVGLLAAILFGALWSREMNARQAAEARLAQTSAASAAANAAIAAAPALGPADSPAVALPTGATAGATPGEASGETLALPGEAAAPAAPVPAATASPPAAADIPPPRTAPPAGAPAAAAPTPPPQAPAPVTEPVPYGEVALAGARIEMLRATLSRAVAQGFRGVAEVRTYSARFCLAGSATEGYALAAEDIPVTKCDLIGNPHDEAMPATQRESLDFANLVGSIRQASGNGIEVRVVPAEAGALLAPYPAVGDKTLAGEWNRAAAANNRIEMRLRPGR